MEQMTIERLRDELGQSYGYRNIVTSLTGVLRGWDDAINAILDMSGDAFKEGDDQKAHLLRDLAKKLRSHLKRKEIDAELVDARLKMRELCEQISKMSGDEE